MVPRLPFSSEMVYNLLKQGKKIQQIADVLGCHRTTVQSRLKELDVFANNKLNSAEINTIISLNAKGLSPCIISEQIGRSAASIYKYLYLLDLPLHSKTYHKTTKD